MSERIGFIGAGKLASGLAMALHALGYEIAAVSSRTSASAQGLAALVPGMTPLPNAAEVATACDIVFVATPDAVIEEMARSVSWRPSHGVIHCSGALSLEVLASAGADGASVASFHPLQTLACIDTPQEAAERLSGICYALEADGWLHDWLEKVAHDLGGHAISLSPEDRPLYHQAAVFACGYLSTLLDAAEEMWSHMGFSPEQARRALTPLALTTVANFGRAGAHASVTGPIPRGDVATVERQLAAISTSLPELAPLASQLGLRSVSFAPDEHRQALNGVLQSATEWAGHCPSNPQVAPASDHSTR